MRGSHFVRSGPSPAPNLVRWYHEPTFPVNERFYFGTWMLRSICSGNRWTLGPASDAILEFTDISLLFAVLAER